MFVKNVEPRLIRVGGEFIAPNETVEIDDKAVGLDNLLERGVLVKVEQAKAEKKAEKKE